MAIRYTGEAPPGENRHIRHDISPDEPAVLDIDTDQVIQDNCFPPVENKGLVLNKRPASQLAD